MEAWRVSTAIVTIASVSMDSARMDMARDVVTTRSKQPQGNHITTTVSQSLNIARLHHLTKMFLFLCLFNPIYKHLSFSS